MTTTAQRAGSFNLTEVLSAAELDDAATGAWTPTASLEEALRAHTMTLSLNGNVLAVAGGGVNGRLADAEIYTP